MTAWLLRIREVDQTVLLALLERRRQHLDRLMRIVTHAGDAVVMISVAVLLALAAGPELRQAAVHSVFALATSHALVQLLKRTVARPRPRLPAGITALAAPPDRFSFPSGHAAATLSMALPLAVSLPPVFALPVMGLAVLTGVSRCYLGVHYPGDVLAGWALATSTVIAAPAGLTWLGLP